MAAEKSSYCAVAILQTYLVIRVHLVIKIMSMSTRSLLKEFERNKDQRNAVYVGSLGIGVATEITRTMKQYIRAKPLLLDSRESVGTPKGNRRL